ncbi:hypothetical protein HYT54_04705 [Candidatus Woesearchaeota archaeon]|nr:hypothetical protein [Candidatus Woesearchaeota archaeon]
MSKIKLKKRHLFMLIAISLVIVLCTSLLVHIIVNKFRKQNDAIKSIKLPRRFNIGIFASGLGGSIFAYPGPNQGPRFMEFYNDVLFVSVPGSGKIFALPDGNKDGEADGKIVVMDKLNNPHGIAFYNDWMYVANEDSIIRVKIGSDMKAVENTSERIADLPSGGHWTRTIRINNQDIYVAIGSSCNLCEESDERRASIMKCSLDGKCGIFAKGIRNAVGFAKADICNGKLKRQLGKRPAA